jgi:hypothetical protein
LHHQTPLPAFTVLGLLLRDEAASAASQTAQRTARLPVTLLPPASQSGDAGSAQTRALSGVAFAGTAIILDRASQASGRRLQTHSEVVHG